ncbi:MAG: hypothetical protein O7D93_02305 [Acidobacteria bacterium]|nr:hypothetical protein [Acidobacteriota bacterium]
MRCVLLLELLTLTTLFTVSGNWGMSYGEALKDLDHDGLEDSFEQEILLRFLPEFRVSKTECAGLPAEFLSDRLEPLPVALNGTIYGQVFPVSPNEISGSSLEIHYYHLWSRDCGRFGHDLDTEHVSVLVQSDSPKAAASRWKALYWYAAAHEGTLCDASNGVKANAIPGRDPAVTLWISSGKHASFLTENLCHRVGCGGDRCEQMVPFSPGKIINVGEPGAPLNGAVWIASGAWPLDEKMTSDFDDSVLLRLERLEKDEVDFVSGVPLPFKAVLLGGNKTIGALEKGHSETRGALSITIQKTGRSLNRALSEAGRALQLSVKKVGKWLGVGP